MLYAQEACRVKSGIFYSMYFKLENEFPIWKSFTVFFIFIFINCFFFVKFGSKKLQNLIYTFFFFVAFKYTLSIRISVAGFFYSIIVVVSKKLYYLFNIMELIIMFGYKKKISMLIPDINKPNQKSAKKSEKPKRLVCVCVYVC